MSLPLGSPIRCGRASLDMDSKNDWLEQIWSVAPESTIHDLCLCKRLDGLYTLAQKCLKEKGLLYELSTPSKIEELTWEEMMLLLLSNCNSWWYCSAVKFMDGDVETPCPVDITVTLWIDEESSF